MSSEIEFKVPNEKEEEPLLAWDTREDMKPIPEYFAPIFKMYKEDLLGTFWVADHYDVTQDLADWKNASPSIKKCVGTVLTFFSMSELLVIENAMNRFLKEMRWIEIQCFYAAQILNENVHMEQYSNLFTAYFPDRAVRELMMKKAKASGAIRKKHEYAKKWMASDKPLAIRLLAFALLEGIMFSSSFCIIYWIKTKNILRALCDSNEAISRDEGTHTKFAILLFTKYVKHRPPASIVYQLFSEAVEIEKEFARECLPEPLIGMDSDMMSQYIEYVADRWLYLMQYDVLYKAKNPFPFMTRIGVGAIDNFFDKTPTAYAIADISGTDKTESLDISSNYGEFLL